MVKQAFELALKELGDKLKIPLKADENNTCLIHFPNGLEVQIEPFEKKEELLICALLGEPPAGQYREDLFKTALIANGYSFPNVGTLGYSIDSKHLILFDHLPFKEISGDKLMTILDPFMRKALKWKEAIEGQTIPAVHPKGANPAKGGSAPFGLG